MITSRDPATMAPKDRLTEIAAILATGYRRLQLRHEKEGDEPSLNQLAASPQPEASCNPLDGPENQEVA